MILNTTTLAHDAGQARCQQHGGMLPEPRSQQENDFLDQLGTKMFLLGMNDKVDEGVWQWDSDGSEVIFQNWAPGQAENGVHTGVPEHCAVMVEQYAKNWHDLPCSSDPLMDGHHKSLICQRKIGM